MHTFNSISKSVLLFLVLSAGLALHTSNYYDPAADEAALTEKLDNYRQDILRLGEEISNLRKALSDTPSNKSISIAHIQEAMAN